MPTSAYNKINYFVSGLALAQFNFSTSAGHTFSIMLTNTVPVSSMKTSTDITNISTGNGYTALGSTCAIVMLQDTATAATLIVGGSTVVFTASSANSTAGIGPFRYPVLLDQSTAYGGSPLLIAWYDYGSAITLNPGETFTVSFDSSSGILQIT